MSLRVPKQSFSLIKIQLPLKHNPELDGILTPSILRIAVLLPRRPYLELIRISKICRSSKLLRMGGRST